jgi:hypothetical protein
MAYGLKEWVLSPPIATSYSKATAVVRYESEHGKGSPSSSSPSSSSEEEYVNDDDNTFRCTQHAGDVFYVPTLWGHGTFNHVQSIGTAFEISLESFCME